MKNSTSSRPPIETLLLALVVATISACGYSEAAMQVQRDRVRALEANNRVLADEVRGLGGDVQSLTAERQQLSSSVQELEAQRTALRESLGSAHQALDAMRTHHAQAEERMRLFRSMLERFRAMIDAGQLRVRVARNRMVVELPESVLFDTGLAELKVGGQRVLEQVSEVLRTMERDFQIAGHTDNVPIHNARFASNWELSSACALTVTHFLLEHGVTAERLSGAGHADTQPVAANDSADGRQQNRRIEIVLLPRLDELPDLTPLQELEHRPAP